MARLTPDRWNRNALASRRKPKAKFAITPDKALVRTPPDPVAIMRVF